MERDIRHPYIIITKYTLEKTERIITNGQIREARATLRARHNEAKNKQAKQTNKQTNKQNKRNT